MWPITALKDRDTALSLAGRGKACAHSIVKSMGQQDSGGKKSERDRSKDRLTGGKIKSMW